MADPNFKNAAVMSAVDVLDVVRTSDENNYRASRARIGDSAAIADDLAEGYQLLADIFCKSEILPTDDIALAPMFLLASRYHMDFGLVTCLRGHLSDAMVHTRRAIDACGYAWRIKREPELAKHWLDNDGATVMPRSVREKFSVRGLFPEDDKTLSVLGERWRVCSRFAHPTLASFAQNSTKVQDGTEHRYLLRTCEVTDDNPAEPITRFLWIADTHLEILRAYGQKTFEPAILSAPFRWSVKLNDIEGKLIAHKERWRDVILGQLHKQSTPVFKRTAQGLYVPATIR
jgi:hypothetical protein